MHCLAYVREPSGALTQTLLSCSFQTVSYTALHSDLNPVNSAIRLIPSIMTSRSLEITQCGSEFIHYSQYFQKLSHLVCLIFFKKGRNKSGSVSYVIKIRERGPPGDLTVYQQSAFASPRSTDNRRSKSIFIPMTPLFSSSTSAICSSPAAHLNWRAPRGTYRWFTTVVCLNILSCTPLTCFNLEIITVLR